jgi:hypothetical protein
MAKKKEESKKKIPDHVVTLRIPAETLAQFKAVCYEAGNISRTVAINRILDYLLLPTSISTAKSIIQDR